MPVWSLWHSCEAAARGVNFSRERGRRHCSHPQPRERAWLSPGGASPLGLCTRPAWHHPPPCLLSPASPSGSSVRTDTDTCVSNRAGEVCLRGGPVGGAEGSHRPWIPARTSSPGAWHSLLGFQGKEYLDRVCAGI